MAIRTKKEAVAQHLGCDFADMNDMTYQPGHHSGQIWTSGDDYYTATSIKRSEKPPVERDLSPGDHSRWQWQKIPNSFIESQGWQIWIHYCD